MIPFPVLIYEQTTECVLGHCRNLALGFPIRGAVPLAGAGISVQIETYLFQTPIRKPTTIETPCPLSIGKPLTTGTVPVLKTLAFCFDGFVSRT